MTSIVTSQKRSFVELAGWIVFCAVCLQLALSPWYFSIMPGEKVNIYFGILATLALLTALLTSKKEPISVGWSEIVVSLVLIVLAITSSFQSTIPFSSSVRAFVLMATGLGGFWCSRILVNTPHRQQSFMWLCTFILAALVVASLAGHYLLGQPTALLSMQYKNAHPLLHMLLILLFAPLSLIASRKLFKTVIGALLLIGVLPVIYYCSSVGGVLSGMLALPIVLCIVVFAAPSLRLAVVCLIFLLLTVATTSYYIAHTSNEPISSPTYQAYRIESYPFSLHVVKKHPFLGVGLRTPRYKYLDDYEIRDTYLNKEEYRKYLKSLVTPENTFLALLTGCGIPFFLTYMFALIVLYVRLIRLIYRPPAEFFFHPLVLFISLTGSLLHSFTTDTMMLPQLCWFFHILLGIIPRRVPESASSVATWQGFSFRFGGAIGSIVLGVLLGTHPALAPSNLSKGVTFSSIQKKLPFLSALTSNKEARTCKTLEKKQNSQPVQLLPGGLLVKLDNFQAPMVKWKVVLILDNSKTMAKRDIPWIPSRLEVAEHIIEKFSHVAPTGSQIDVKAFFDGYLLKMGPRDIPITASRSVYTSTKQTHDVLLNGLRHVVAVARTDVCAAAAQSARSDFRKTADLSPRLILFTDGKSHCWSEAMSQVLQARKANNIGPVDVVALGVDTEKRGLYEQLAHSTEGLFHNLNNPDETDATLDRFKSIFLVRKPVKITISGNGKTMDAYIGKRIDLPQGSFSVWLPSNIGQEWSNKVIPNVEVKSALTTVLVVSSKNGQLIVKSQTK